MTGRLQIKDGFWYTIINYKDSDGKYKYKWETTGLTERGNKKEANRILQERIQNFEEAKQIKNEKILARSKPKQNALGTADTKFVDYCKAYIETRKNKLSDSTYHIYKTYYLRIFKEYFQDKTVMDITTEEIDGFYDYMKKERKVTNTTLKHYNDVIRPALKYAFEEDKIIPDNPYLKARKLSREKRIVSFYNKKELDVLFDVLKDHKLELAYKMLACYGLRRSELLGLRWDSIDFINDAITINHKVIKVEKKLTAEDTLKNTSSFRSLPLIPLIREDLIKWKKQVNENRSIYGNTYNHQWSKYIFVDEQGTLYNPDYLTHAFGDILKENNLKYIRLHDLRHSCASLLLASGINLKQIQDWLGHADFSTTANIYSHLDYTSKMQSANAISGAFAKKLQIQEEENDDIEPIYNSIRKDMERLGIRTFEDYAIYLEEQKNIPKLEKKSEMEM